MSTCYMYIGSLHTCSRYIYMFGFIMMTPQLYINYRLQSVEHLPWRALTYFVLLTAHLSLRSSRQ